MTLPSAGNQIAMSQINTELGRSSNATISLDTAENGGYVAINTNSPSYPSAGNPAAMSEWWSYNHNATTTTAGCQCISNTCSSPCFCNGAFCYDVNDCGGPGCL
jgi:hypothetical protein